MFNKTTLQAIKALTLLAQLPPGKYAGAGALAREIGAGQNYLGKLLQSLARQGLVKSQKGLGGGFALARPPQDITLYEIAATFEELERWNGCFF